MFLVNLLLQMLGCFCTGCTKSLQCRSDSMWISTGMLSPSVTAAIVFLAGAAVFVPRSWTAPRPELRPPLSTRPQPLDMRFMDALNLHRTGSSCRCGARPVEVDLFSTAQSRSSCACGLHSWSFSAESCACLALPGGVLAAAAQQRAEDAQWYGIVVLPLCGELARRPEGRLRVSDRCPDRPLVVSARAGHDLVLQGTKVLQAPFGPKLKLGRKLRFPLSTHALFPQQAAPVFARGRAHLSMQLHSMWKRRKTAAVGSAEGRLPGYETAAQPAQEVPSRAQASQVPVLLLSGQLADAQRRAVEAEEQWAALREQFI